MEKPLRPLLEGDNGVGFAKSGLAQSIYAELKAHRLNRPATSAPESPLPESDSSSKAPMG